MRAVVMRVKHASVTIDGRDNGAIGQGLLILLGVAPTDTPALCDKLAEKALGLRIFCDENGKMNRSLADVGGQVLVVSQFTLFADCKKGKRPSFFGAAAPKLADALYERFLDDCPWLRAAARRIRRGYAGGVLQRRAGHDPARYGRLDVRFR